MRNAIKWVEVLYVNDNIPPSLLQLHFAELPLLLSRVPSAGVTVVMPAVARDGGRLASQPRFSFCLNS